MNKIKFNDYNKGDEIPEINTGELKHMDLVRYTGASGDFNPIHTDPEFAKSVGLDGTIAHGMYIMALVGRMCTSWAHPTIIKSFGVKFRGMTKPGETIICSGKVKRKVEKEQEKLLTVAVQAANSDGAVKVSGDLVIRCE